MVAFRGVAFRSTSGYVTDGTDDTYCIGELYPVNRSTGSGTSLTFGWVTSAASKADRNSGVDARLAGINFIANSSAKKTFRFDLPATGDATIRLALGDMSSSQTQTAVLKDNGTAFATFSAVATINGQFVDAAGNKWTNTGWPGSNVTITHTFTSTVFEIEIGAGSGSAATTIAYVGVDPVSGWGGSTYTLPAANGSFSESGQAASLTAARKLTAALGSFALSGQGATLTGPGAKTLTAAAGSFALTGQDIGLEVAVPAGLASFTLTGQAATLKAGRKLAAAAGAHTLTGQDVTFIESQSYTLSAAVAAFALSGKAVRFDTNASPWGAVSAASGTWTPKAAASGEWSAV